MSEKEYNNTFRFTLSQGNVMLCEKIFDADNFNPFTRYSIDIRDILPRAITKLQKTLSKRKYDTLWDCGRKDVTIEGSSSQCYDIYQYVENILNSYPAEIQKDLQYNPQSIVQQIEDKTSSSVEFKTIRGVECKIGFYINDKPIVERLFYVDGFNPVSRWSVDLIDAVTEISNMINNKIKVSDVKNMWDDYDLINMRGLSINQIRELSIPKREEMLRKLRRN